MSKINYSQKTSELIECGIVSQRASEILNAIESLIKTLNPETSSDVLWQSVSKKVLKTTDAFAAHLKIFDWIYTDWNAQKQGPPPVWIPDLSEIPNTHLAQVSSQKGFKNFSQFWSWSVKNREEFWTDFFERTKPAFRVPPTKIFSHSLGQVGFENPKFLLGAQFNIVESCFLAESKKTALVVGREGSKEISKISYGELLGQVKKIASGITALGLKPSDAIAIDMPMTPESVAIYLGILWAGCAAVSIADSFAPEEISTRLRISKAKAIFTQDFLVRGSKNLALYQKVKEAHAPKAIVIKVDQKTELRAGDISWSDFLAGAQAQAEPFVGGAECVANILFSSGTTGDPKAIPWTHATPFKCAMDAFYHHDLHPDDVLAWPTNLGWMMGPWLIFAALLNRSTVALFDGAPHTREFGDFVARSEVTVLGLVPSLVKAWRHSKVMDGVNWSKIKAFSSTGEASNSEDYFWLMALAGYKPVIEYCGGTEIGGGFLTGTLVQPAIPATFSTPSMGLDVVLLNDERSPAQNGELFVVPPSLGLSQSLLNRDHEDVYFKDCPRGPDGTLLRRHGDQVERLANGYLRALGRADDTMNLGGIKVSSAEIERVVNTVEGILETAAVALNPPGGGPSLLKIFVVLKPGTGLENLSPGEIQESELKSKMQKEISSRLNPLFKLNEIKLVPSLPRTASNKVMRRLLR